MDVWWLAYPVLGIFAGFAAGLLGVGGGTILVPLLNEIMAQQGFSLTQRVHLALGTSMAVIVLSSIGSVRAHNARGAVLWPIVLAMAPWLIVGTFSTTWLAAQIPARPLILFFSCFLLAISAQMYFNFKPKHQRNLPDKLGLALVSLVIGGISALVAIGGGALAVPFLTWCNVDVRKAIGTSAAIGFPIALSGALGYIINGWHSPELPPYSLGYVYLPAFALVASFSFMSAPFGARLAHRMPIALLKKIFAGLLFCLAIKMFYSLAQAQI